MPRQEPGTRPSAPLPYELIVNGQLSEDRKQLTLRFEARNERFGAKSAGSPFIAYARRGNDDVQIRNYAVSPGDQLEDVWRLEDFPQGAYDIAVYGPNGFFRHIRGSADDPALDVQLETEPMSHDGRSAPGRLEVQFQNREHRSLAITIADHSYGALPVDRIVDAEEQLRLVIDTESSHGWYDLSIYLDGYHEYDWRFAGRVETGAWGSSDPAMG